MRIFLIAIAAVLVTGAGATAQSPPAPPGEKVPEGQKAPPEIVPQDDKQKKDDENLSEQLSRDKGVIKPPATGTPDMSVKPPVPDPNTTPVIPPPGSPGGKQDVIPK